MKKNRTLQEWVHWLEMGPGSRWVRRAALLVGIILLSLRLGYTEFRGPQTETTLAQAVAGRQLADGDGFTTLVRYPQTLAVLRANGVRPDLDRPWPELHQPPLYAAVIGGALKVLPAPLRHSLFQAPPVTPDGFHADYFLLGLNVVLLWLAAWLSYLLGRRLFDPFVGLLASLGLLLSASIWTQTVAVNGTPLMMVLCLLLVHALACGDSAVAEGRPLRLWFFFTGLLCGLMALCDFPAGLVLAPVLVFAGLRCRGRARTTALLGVVIGFTLVVYPWMARNRSLTGSPFGLARDSVALKAGDPTAEPETVRDTLLAEGPAVDLHKLGNKGLTALQAALRDQVWSAGMVFTALFAVGLLYQFRSAAANRMRWLAVGLAVTLVSAQAFLDSGEGERLPAYFLVPLFAVFGAGFFSVLVASNDRLAPHFRWLGFGLLALQALPLTRDVLEPRHLHFNYPPYHPAVYVGMRGDSLQRKAPWMADVPAGAAWYSGQLVWAQPARLRDFYAVGAEQPVYALVLSPHTLNRPYFGGLDQTGLSSAGTDWAQVYAGLVTNRYPAGFPLIMSQKVSDNLYVLFNPHRVLGM